MIKTRRAYDPPRKEVGLRILVDRLWPRGLKKKEAGIDEWLKELAPSNELRRWLSHDPEKWLEFRKRYFKELKDHERLIEAILEKVKDQSVVLVYAAKEETCNNAVALKEYLDMRAQRGGKPSSSDAAFAEPFTDTKHPP